MDLPLLNNFHKQRCWPVNCKIATLMGSSSCSSTKVNKRNATGIWGLYKYMYMYIPVIASPDGNLAHSRVLHQSRKFQLQFLKAVLLVQEIRNQFWHLYHILTPCFLDLPSLVPSLPQHHFSVCHLIVMSHASVDGHNSSKPQNKQHEYFGIKKVKRFFYLPCIETVCESKKV